MKKNCMKCHKEVDQSDLNYRMECSDCERKRRDEEDSPSLMTKMAMGDMLGTGIPGGLDMDITTPL